MESLTASLNGFLAVLAFGVIIWGIGTAKKDISVIDRVWGLFFVLLSFVYTLSAPEVGLRAMVVLICITIWGTRLSVYIHFRNKGHPEDYRYQQMRERHDPKKFLWYSLVAICWLQAGLALVISAPLFVVALYGHDIPFTGFDVAGLVVWIIGFYFEAVGDLQLSNFKKNPKNKGKLLTTGLWAMTRHPNYFGDTVQWWGIFLFTLSIPWGFTSFFGPLLMTYTIIKISGVSLLEKGLTKSKPGYEDYVAKTPAFVPNWSSFLRGLKGGDHPA